MAKLIGHDKLRESFKKLIKKNQLSHAYLFFGEPGVGKFSFAHSLASYLETGDFEIGPASLAETLIVEPDEMGTISIQRAREAKYFLSQKPSFSSRRIVIIDEAQKLTAEAQNAILKLAEEPPATGLIILVLANPEGLIRTLQSRLQKIYFPRIGREAISKLLVRELKLSQEKAEEISALAYGRPGRAMGLATGRIKRFNSRGKGTLLEAAAEKSQDLEAYFTELIAELARDPRKNYLTLRKVLNRLTQISQYNTNKRLQLESALWNI